MSRYRLFMVIATLFIAGCSSDYRAPDKSGAEIATISRNIITPPPDLNILTSKTLGTIGAVNFTSLTAIKDGCDGVGGSMVPPLSKECAVRAAFLTVTAFSSILPAGRTIALQGLENYYVSQGDKDLCWAAALEMARAYLHKTHVPFSRMSALVADRCPSLDKKRDPASLYRIFVAAGIIDQTIDHGNSRFMYCDSGECIVQAIQRGRPVIVLRHSHAVLIQGVELEQGGGTPLIHAYHILDPATGSNNILIEGPLAFCDADAFMVL